MTLGLLFIITGHKQEKKSTYITLSSSNLPFKCLKITARSLEAVNYITALYQDRDHCLCFFSMASQYGNIRVRAASSPLSPYTHFIRYQLTTLQNADIFLTDITLCRIYLGMDCNAKKKCWCSQNTAV